MGRASKKLRAWCFVWTVAVLVASQTPAPGQGADWSIGGSNPTAGDRLLAEYFALETKKLADRCLADVRSAADWEKRRPQLRRQLLEMFGLDPLPERTPLKPVVTGRVERDTFYVEKLHFQSRPHLYVTANLYVPKNLTGPAPAVLYVCGHGPEREGNVSYGNKTHYQHHGAWFARNGYVCLVMDTLQLGEIEGIHHGLYRYGRWWWVARGYTPAGVEAWNCIRALDYLQSRKEVDPDRIGVTGRSGGGAYSWWIAALDDRIKVAVPVAGMTTLKNHVVDGCVEGHCDCMYVLNTYRWDYPQVAALVAPRPLLIENSDKDRIFPLDGVVDLYFRVRRVYELLGQLDHVGLQITEGPHRDTQELRVGAFHWFNRWLKGEDPLIEQTAVPLFDRKELKVFDKLPEDEINTRIDELFVPKAPPPQVPKTVEAWHALAARLVDRLKTKSFRGWPDDSRALGPAWPTLQQEQRSKDLRLSVYSYNSQRPYRLPLYVLRSASESTKPQRVVLKVLDEAGWNRFARAAVRLFPELRPSLPLPPGGPKEPDAESAKRQADRWVNLVRSKSTVLCFVAPRGVGPTAWTGDERKQTHIRRRFILLGQTLDGMRVWDVLRALQALEKIPGLKGKPLTVEAQGVTAGVALYASVFGPAPSRLRLTNLPATHRDGPIFLNVLRFLDIPEALALAAERVEVLELEYRSPPKGQPWGFAQQVTRLLGRPGTVQVKVEEEAQSKAADRPTPQQ